jgi:hypothetical protein
MAWPLQQTFCRAARVALALGAVLCLAEARAYAGCNAHIAFSFHGIAASSSSTGPATSHQQNAAASDLTVSLPCSKCSNSSDVPDNTPCRGPFCSGNKVPAGLPTTTAPGPNVHEQLTALASRTCAEQEAQSNWLSPDQFVVPITSVDPIFHPPR